MGTTIKPGPVPGKPVKPPPSPRGVSTSTIKPGAAPGKPVKPPPSQRGVTNPTGPAGPAHAATSRFEPRPGNRQVVIGSLLPGLEPYPLARERQATTSPCPPPTATANGSEAARVWSDLHVAAAHGLLASRGVDCATVGRGQTVAFVDNDPAGHGAYTAALATGDVGAPWGDGTLTGIAPGARSTNVTFVRQPGAFLEPALWAVAQPGAFVANEQSRGFSTTFTNAASAAGTTGVVAFTNAAPSTMSDAEALGFLAQVRGYVAQGGVVVLPGNLFGEAGASPAVRSALETSGALVVQPVVGGAVPDARHGQPPTSAVNVAVPTTNGNNSVAVPAVAAVAVLLREANPALTGVQVTDLLTNPAAFDTVLVDGAAVPVLDAARAVEAASAAVHR